mgnify:CR=1 FL=1
MKRVKRVYDNMIDYDKVLKVYNKLKVTSRNKKEVFSFSLNLNENIYNILNKLKNGTYKFGKYNIFLIKEPKYRLIMSENFTDKIVNHLFSNELISVLDKTLIYSNVATRCYKGSNLAYKLFVKYTNKLLYKDDIYVLKIDISKFFYNINHNILIKLCEEKIKDKKAIKFLKDILSTTNYSYINKEIKRIIKGKNIDVPLYKYGYGLPIGNMSSQILAVFFLSKIDHLIKEKLKCKYYIRYMDDLVILDSDKSKLKNIYSDIVKLIESFDLKVNDKSRIYNLSNGVDFLGYNFKINNGLIIRYKKDTIKRIDKKLTNLFIYDINRLYKVFPSYKGYLSFSNTVKRSIYL